MLSNFRVLSRLTPLCRTSCPNSFKEAKSVLNENSLSSIVQSVPVVRSFHYSASLLQGLGDPPAPEVPLYDALNIQVKGYDFAVLEKYAKYVHRTADRIGLEVEDSWATPAQNLKITQLKPESDVVESEYFLNMYERNVQIVQVPATLLPVLVNIIEASIPAGVTLRVHPHTQEHTEIRYVPDLELKELKQQLEDMSYKKK